MDSLSLVAFPFHDWRKGEREGVRTRDGHLLRELANDARIDRILVIDRPVSAAERLLHPSWSPVVAGKQIGRRRHGRRVLTLTEVAPRVVVLDVGVPDLLSVARRPRRWWFQVFRSRGLIDAVEWAIDVAGLGSPGAIAWTPTAEPVITALRFKPFLFDSLDNWITHPQLRREIVEATAAYGSLLPLADRVVVTARASARALSRWVPDPLVIPNGVDQQRFQGRHVRPSDVPPGQVVGYAGKLADRIDVELCAAVARAHPHARFVFVGPVMDPRVRRLARLPNVALLGDRSPDEIPAYLSSFDVAWIPHRVGEGETGGDPIKLYEYWAAHCQVVTTRIDGSDAWLDRAFVVSSAADAVRVVGGLLDGSVPPKPVGITADRTWSFIAATLVDLLIGARPR